MFPPFLSPAPPPLAATPTVLPLPQGVTATFSRRSYLPSSQSRYWLIKAGVVRTLTYLEDGTTVTLGVWGPGDVVGGPLATADPHVMEVLTEVEATAIAATTWQPPVTTLLNYRQQVEKLLLLRANRRAEIALLGVLQWLANRFGHPLEQGCLIDVKITHQDLADLSGASRVTVTRLLRQFEEQGLLYRRSRQLILAEATEHWHYEI